MTLLQQRKLFVLRIKVHFPKKMATILDLMSIVINLKQFWCLIKTFVDIFNDLSQEIISCTCLKSFSQSNRGHIGISRHCYHKTINQRWKHTWHYRVHTDKGFPPCCLLLTKELRVVIFSRCAPRLYGTNFYDFSRKYSFVKRISV